ncbi:MAG TPA: peptide chain release factor N(5)-glutamine methyltransferase [Flavobacteriaceae bacterium]|nr:peptide chain release factor N(5)-glutamine methyltransferase [Flavobacteriaceae bacterium]
MTLQDYRNHFKEQLQSHYPEEEVQSFFYFLVETILELKKAMLPLELQRTLKQSEVEKFNTALEQLKKEVPIQHILGKTEFFGLELIVNNSVLIPRPETEELVDWVLKEASPKAKILDIGTGSGAIAIALAKNLPSSKVVAFDISEKAIQTAKENAKHNEVEVTFIQQDILKTAALEGMYDIIVSNPPYIKNSEKTLMQNNVLLYEPHQALFVADDSPLLFYNKIAELTREALCQGGQLFYEINEAHGAAVVQMLKAKGFSNVKLRKDFFGKDRMVLAEKL